MVILLAAFALAGDPPAPQPKAKAADPLICRHTEVTGTRIGAPVLCRTRSQWQQDKIEAERMLDRNQGKDVIQLDPYAIPTSRPQ